MIEIIVGDYSANDPESYLAKLDQLSHERKDGGLFHGGHIHFIQEKLSNEDGMPFFLKAAIHGILDRVPRLIPYELPELAEKAEKEGEGEMEESVLAKLRVAYDEINESLILPIVPRDFIRVILAARKYETEKKDA